MKLNRAEIEKRRKAEQYELKKYEYRIIKVKDDKFTPLRIELSNQSSMPVKNVSNIHVKRVEVVKKMKPILERVERKEVNAEAGRCNITIVKKGGEHGKEIRVECVKNECAVRGSESFTRNYDGKDAVIRV
jgi:hypothetical protein